MRQRGGEERGLRSNSPQACWRLLAALQRDRELAGVSRKGRGRGGLKETERGGVEERLSSVGLPASQAGQCDRGRRRLCYKRGVKTS